MTDTKPNQKPYRQHKASTHNLTFTITSEAEEEQFYGIACGRVEPEKCVWTIPPYRWTAA